MLQHQALRTALFRHKSDPRADRLGFVGDVETLSIEFEVTRVGPLHAGCQMRKLRAPGPDQSAERQHLAAKEVETHALDGAPPGDVADREDGLARSICREALTIFGRTDIVADDGADEFLLVETSPLGLVDDLAVAQDSNPSDAASFITGQAVVIDGGGFVAGADQL